MTLVHEFLTANPTLIMVQLGDTAYCFEFPNGSRTSQANSINGAILRALLADDKRVTVTRQLAIELEKLFEEFETIIQEAWKR